MSLDTLVESQPALAAPSSEDARALNRTAHVAGLIYVAFAVISAWGFFYVRNQFSVPGDAFATVHRMLERATLYRLGLLGDLVSQFLFLYLVVELYELFKGVDRRLARQMVVLVGAGVAATVVSIGIHTMPLVLQERADFLSALTKPQVDALAIAFLRLGNALGALLVAFWGVWLIPFGLLTIRCGFLPKILGWLLLASAFGYIVTAATSTAFPGQLPLVAKLVFPLAFAEFPIILWLAIAGARFPATRR